MTAGRSDRPAAVAFSRAGADFPRPSRLRKTVGGVDIDFAHAGIQSLKPLLEMSDPDWHDQIDVNPDRRSLDFERDRDQQ